MLKSLWKLAKLGVIYLYIFLIYLNFGDKAVVEKFGFFPKGGYEKILNPDIVNMPLQNKILKILIF